MEHGSLDSKRKRTQVRTRRSEVSGDVELAPVEVGIPRNRVSCGLNHVSHRAVRAQASHQMHGRTLEEPTNESAKRGDPETVEIWVQDASTAPQGCTEIEKCATQPHATLTTW